MLCLKKKSHALFVKLITHTYNFCSLIVLVFFNHIAAMCQFFYCTVLYLVCPVRLDFPSANDTVSLPGSNRQTDEAAFVVV